MKPKIVLGPYILRTPAGPVLTTRECVPLGISVEWTTTDQAHQVGLLATTENSGRTLKLENILVPANQLPFPVECHLQHVVQTPKGAFVPFEALLVRLYETHIGGLPIFGLTNELTSFIPIRNTVSAPLKRTGLLIPEIEARDYRLNTILPHPDGPIAEITWEPRADRDPFHVCLCRLSTRAQSTKCEWIPSRNIGISQLFAAALRQIVPGSPAKIFSRLGLDVLMSRLQQEVASHPAD